MKWSDNAWNTIQPIYNKILELPFIKELIDGALENDKFIFYIRQDALYLSEYGKVLSGIASRLSKPEHINEFIHFSGDCIAVENALHESFLRNEPAKQTASPSCLLYTSYLLSQLTTATVEVQTAAVLPCFWIYKAVGDYILENQKAIDNPYQDWIDTYGGEDFAISVSKAIDICDELAGSCTEQQQAAMTEAFVMASKFEWMFWDSAYNIEQWKI